MSVSYALTKLKGQKKIIFIIAFVVCLIAFFAVYLYYGNTSLTVSVYDVHSEKIPPEFDGFCIVQISDLHNTHNPALLDSLIQKTEEASPDMIILTGDVIDSRLTDVDTAINSVKRLVEIAPVYFVTGNHEARTGEYYKLSKALRKAGVTELNNSFVNVRLNEDEIVVAGIDDPMTAHENYVSDELIASERLGSMKYSRDMFTVLLSHRPELFNTYTAYGVDLVFTGHAHGGLIRLPFIGGLFAPHQGLFPKYSEGCHSSASTEMIVSRGVGNSGHTLRINDNPELVVAILHAG